MEIDLVSSRVDIIVDIIRHATFTSSCLRHAASASFGWTWIFVIFTHTLRQWQLADMEVLGIVTQGQAATCCGGTVGVCERRCPPPHPCKGGGEVLLTFLIALARSLPF